MRCWSLFLAIVFLAAFTLQGAAQAPRAPSPVETVTVIAHPKGPAIWYVKKGGASVAILGIVEPLPDNFVWNTKPLEEILAGAQRVLLPARIQMGIFSGAWFYLTESGLLHPPYNKSLKDILDQSVEAELAQECEFLNESKERYNDNAPILAARRLASDFRHVFLLTTHEPEDTVAALARARRVVVRRIATYDLVPSGEELLKLPPAVTGRCIDASIRDIDFQSRHVSAAAEAWATGDITGMMVNSSPSHLYECLIELSSHATALDARSIDDTVAAIDEAIADGGRTVAVVDIGILLRKGGVLDRLNADGIPSYQSPVQKFDF